MRSLVVTKLNAARALALIRTAILITVVSVLTLCLLARPSVAGPLDQIRRKYDEKKKAYKDKAYEKHLAKARRANESLAYVAGRGRAAQQDPGGLRKRNTEETRAGAKKVARSTVRAGQVKNGKLWKPRQSVANVRTAADLERVRSEYRSYVNGQPSPASSNKAPPPAQSNKPSLRQRV